ncbi:MAG: hypothetical protein GXO68_05765 [Crenarchaeota archaeon]|nr:hypothetical protein [Thermoproteota archaeon]
MSEPKVFEKTYLLYHRPSRSLLEYYIYSREDYTGIELESRDYSLHIEIHLYEDTTIAKVHLLLVEELRFIDDEANKILDIVEQILQESEVLAEWDEP